MSSSNLAGFLWTRYQRSGVVADLEEAITLNRDALILPPIGSSDRSLALGNLANSLASRFEYSRKIKDLEDSIDLEREALASRPEGHPLRSLSLNNLASYLHLRFQSEGNSRDLEDAIQSLTGATSHSFSSFAIRLKAAQRWTVIARSYDHPSTLEAYRTAMSLLQLALTIKPTLVTQHKFISADFRFQELPLDAASLATEQDDFAQAIELLEQGRGLLWSQMRGLRSPLEELSRVSKPLAQRYEVCSRNIEALITSRTPRMADSSRGGFGYLGHSSSQEHPLINGVLTRLRKLSEEQAAMISEIRRVPGFEDFLKASPFSAIQRSAAEGPVIVLNLSEYRCDALIVLARRDSQCVCVPLDEDFYADSFQLHEDLLRARLESRVSSARYDATLRRAMKVLWDRVVSKVVQKLKELGVEEGSRIWWCPTSVLSALPFHAAGPYEASNGSMRYLVDDYVSSYTPTLRSLISARSGAESGGERMLFVADPGLRLAPKERLLIRRNRRFKELVGTEATPDAVLKMLRKAHWVHFVCHGALDDEPFNSSLLLPGGKLTLLEIARADFPKAEFAYLSACHTAEQGPKYALDEALYLAAAMQFCGFRSVVGTMWELLDLDGPYLADKVYAYMMQDLEDGEVRFKRAAAAVRIAALGLREKVNQEIHGDGSNKMTERWVNLVHIGA